MTVSVASAAKLPSWVSENDYLNGDDNYILVNVHRQGDIPQNVSRNYLDVSSVNVEYYDPPEYKINWQGIIIDYTGKRTGRYSATCRYIWSEYESDRRMYMKDLQKNDGSWELIIPTDTSVHIRSIRKGGEIAWYICYGMDFYGRPLF